MCGLAGARARAWRLLARGRALFVAGNDGKPPFGKGRDETAANRPLVPPVQRISLSSVGWKAKSSNAVFRHFPPRTAVLYAKPGLTQAGSARRAKPRQRFGRPRPARRAGPHAAPVGPRPPDRPGPCRPWLGAGSGPKRHGSRLAHRIPSGKAPRGAGGGSGGDPELGKRPRRDGRAPGGLCARPLPIPAASARRPCRTATDAPCALPISIPVRIGSARRSASTDSCQSRFDIEAMKVYVKPGLTRTHVLPVPIRTPPVGRPARPPPGG